MSNETKDSRQKVSSCEQTDSPFIWPLGKSPDTPDEMNTSYGPRIDADRWDFHDGIDLPATVRTPVHAMAKSTVHRAGPADKTAQSQGFGSTHVILKVDDPPDGEDLFLVYLHLDSIAEGVIPGAHVNQGDIIGAVGQEDAEYPHLHFEFRKHPAKEENSVHPLHYLPYLNTPNITDLRLDRCNFAGPDGEKRAVRLRFDVRNRLEGDVQGVDIELKKADGTVAPLLHVNFDDRKTIESDKGDEHEFNKQSVAVEGYQKSNLKGEGLNDLHYGVLIKDIAPEFTDVKLQILDARNGQPQTAEFPLPILGANEEPVNRFVGFEGQTFPPRDWELRLLPGNVCRPDAAAALDRSRGLLCQDFQSVQGTLIRAGLRFALPDRLPVRPMSWRLRANIRPAELQMDKGQVIHPLAFLIGGEVVATACLRKIRSDKLVAGVLIRSADGLVRERIDVNEGEIFRDGPARWELELLRVGTRQTTAVVRLNDNVVARINGDTTSVEPDAACVGILHRHAGLQITLHVDQLFLTEALR